MKRAVKYWIVVVSKDHGQRGVTGGFMQASHGKEAPLKRMQPHDWVIFYSPKIKMNEGEKCQKFTAIGEIKDEEIYQLKMSKDFIPYRRNVDFHRSAEVSILPLIPELDFIENKKQWGYRFRFGYFEIPKKDFDLIKSKMLI